MRAALPHPAASSTKSHTPHPAGLTAPLARRRRTLHARARTPFLAPSPAKYANDCQKILYALLH